MSSIIPNDKKNNSKEAFKKKVKNGKSIKEDYPTLEDLMFNNKPLIQKETSKKKYKEWLRNRNNP